MIDNFFTLPGVVSGETKVKRSRFIGHASPIQGIDQIESFLSRIRTAYYDATHCCFAYRLGSGDQTTFRTSDGGEPSGTAGRPILEAIENHGLTDVICTVTRYFGGTKLGTGGLFGPITNVHLLPSILVEK